MFPWYTIFTQFPWVFSEFSVNFLSGVGSFVKRQNLRKKWRENFWLVVESLWWPRRWSLHGLCQKYRRQMVQIWRQLCFTCHREKHCRFVRLRSVLPAEGRGRGWFYNVVDGWHCTGKSGGGTEREFWRDAEHGHVRVKLSNKFRFFKNAFLSNRRSWDVQKIPRNFQGSTPL